MRQITFEGTPESLLPQPDTQFLGLPPPVELNTTAKAYQPVDIHQ